MSYSLTKEEIGRYSRQLLISEIGVSGQARLQSSRVLIVGAGGLGCPVSTYLVGAGIGTVGIVDYDQVTSNNLHRQIAHKECNIGKPKVDSLKESLSELNHLVNIVTHNVVLDRNSAMSIMECYDIIVDCSDNVSTRYLVNDACVLLNKPLVSGSALRWEGQLTVYHYGEKAKGPCYRCLFPTPPNASFVTNCSDGGVVGPVVGVIGSMQALEVLKIAAGIEPSFTAKLYLFDGLSGRSRIVSLRPQSKDCSVCGLQPVVTQLIDYELFCGAGIQDKSPCLNLLLPDQRISPKEYSVIRSSSHPILIDTRPPSEFAIASLEEAKNITLDELRKLDFDSLLKKLGVPSIENEVFIICHRGNDSQLAVEMLRDKLSPIRVKDIQGGYEAWASEVNPQFPTY